MVKRKILAGLLGIAMLFQQAGTVAFAQEGQQSSVEVIAAEEFSEVSSEESEGFSEDVSMEESEESSAEVISTEESEESSEEVISTEESEESSEEVISTEEGEKSSEEVISTEEGEKSSEEVISTEEGEESSEEVISTEESEETSTVVEETQDASNMVSANGENDYANLFSNIVLTPGAYSVDIAGNLRLPEGYVICDSEGVEYSGEDAYMFSEQYNSEGTLVGIEDVYIWCYDDSIKAYDCYNSYYCFEEAVTSKLVLYMKQSSLDGSEEQSENVIKIESESVKHNKNSVKIEMEHVETGISSMCFSLKISGLASWEIPSYSIKVSTSEDMSSTVSGISKQYDWDSQQLVITGLSADTTYWGNVTIFYGFRNYHTNISKTISLGEVSFGPLTTKADEEVVLAEAFPDEAFRTLIRTRLGISSNETTVSLSKLEATTSLDLRRSTLASPAIKSIEGIEYFSNLTSLRLENNEINSFQKIDGTEIDFSKLKRLKRLDLSGNELTEFPDFSALSADCDISVSKNKIEKAENLNEKLPKNYDTSYRNIIMSQLSKEQRIGDPDIRINDIYYAQGENRPFFAFIDNLKTLDYSYLVYIDDVQVEAVTVRHDGNFLTISDCDVVGGTHTVKVVVKTDDTEVVSLEKEVTFAEDIPYAEKKYATPISDLIILEGYIPGDVEITDAQIVSGNGEVIAMATSGIGSGWDEYGTEYRYQNLPNDYYIGEWSNTQVWCRMEWASTPMPGNYNWVIAYEDSTGTAQTIVLSDCIVVTDSPVVEEIYQSYGTNSYDDYWYVNVTGVNLNVADLTIEIYFGKEKVSEEVAEWKPTQEGYIAKIKKTESQKNLDTGTFIYKVKSSDPNAIINIKDEDISFGSSPMYYSIYNRATEKVEVYFDSRVPNGTSVEINVYNLQPENIVATAVGNVDKGRAELTAYKDGEKVSWSSLVSFYDSYVHLTYTLNGEESLQTVYIGAPLTGGESRSNIYSKSTISEDYSKYYVEGFCADGKENGNYQFKLFNEDKSQIFTCKSSSVTASGTKGVTVEGVFDIEGIKNGYYTLQFFNGETEIARKTIHVISKDIFLLDYQSAYWWSDNMLGVYLNTPVQMSDYDKLNIKLTDVNGNEIEGLKVHLGSADNYDPCSSQLFVLVSGLIRENADNMYYMYVSYDGKSEAQKSNGEPYYKDKKGQLEVINSVEHCHTFGGPGADLVYRVEGVRFYHQDCIPATLNIYKEHDTQLVKSIKIDKSDLNYMTYTFKESIWEDLDKNTLYDITVTGADGYCATHDAALIIAYEYPTGSLKISKNSIFLTVNEGEKQKDTFTVTGYTGKVTVTSSNPAVAAVKKTEADNVCTVTVTAVSNGATDVMVTNAGKTYTIPVTVSSKPEAVVINKSSMTLNGIGAQQQLSVSVSPKEAETEDFQVIWSSDKPEIASVDNNGMVTAVGAGEAVITARCNIAGTEYEALCVVTVKGTVTEEELKSAIQGLGTLQIVTNTGNALSDELFGDKAYKETTKEGFTWKAIDGKTPVVSADGSNPVQKISAIYKKGGYEEIETTLPVSVSQVTGINITGDKLLVKEEKAGTELSAELITIGAEIDEDLRDKLVSIKWTSKKGVVSIENNNAFNTKITPVKTGKDTVTAVVTFKNTTVKKGKTQFTCTYNIEVADKPVVNEIKVSVLESETTNIPNITAQSDISEINLEKEQLVNKKNTIALSATAYIADKEADVPLTWSSSDKSVAEVKLVKKQPVLTVKKAGVAEITVTAKDKGKFAVKIPVCVKDYAPIFTDKTLTLNAYAVDGIEFTSLSAYSNEITSISVYEKDGKNYQTKASTNFKVEKKDDTTYTLSIVPGSGIEKTTKKKTVSCKLTFTTAKGSYEYPVKVVVDVKKPTAQLKVKNKLNVFYTDSVAAYTVNSKYPIESVEWVSSATKKDDVKISSYSYSDSVLYLNCLDEQGKSTVTRENYKKLLNKNYSGRKGVVKVKFAGYKDNAIVEIPVTVAVENKASKLKTAVKETALCPSQGLTKSEILICENGEGLELTPEYRVSTTTKGVAVCINDGKVAVNYNGNKNVNAKLEIQKNDWTQKVVISHKINVIKKPQLVLSRNTIVLNKNTTVQENAPVIIDLSIKNNSAEIKNLTRTASGSKNIKLLSDGILSMTYDESAQQLRIGLNKTAISKITKDGSYKISFGGTMEINGTEVNLAPATLTVKLSTKGVTASVKAKGSINLLERQSSYIEYTPVIGNMTSKVEKAELISNDADKFDINVNELGKVYVRAKEGAVLKANTKYSAKFKFTLENGYEVTSKAFVIKPIQKNPKLAVNIKNVTMYHADPIICSYVVSNAQNNSMAEIVGLEVVPNKYTENFEYVDYGDGRMDINLKENSTIKSGKYSITFKVHFKDEASNVKNATVKLSVTVK